MNTLALPRISLRLAAIHPLTVITVAGLALRLLLIDNARLWYDETGSVWMASLTFDRMLAATAGDVHPPLYLAVLWAWVQLAGTSEAAVRLPSAIFSALCVPLTYAIARRLSLSRSIALVAAGLVAVLPSQLNYAQEARMYALLTLEVALALYAALARRWWLFALALAAGYWTHNYGLLYALPLNLAALLQVRSDLRGADRNTVLEDLSWWFVANVIAIALWFPWLPSLIGQMQAVHGRFWIQLVTPGTVLYTLYIMLWAFAPGQALQSHAALLGMGALAFASWRAARLKVRGPLVCLVVVLAALTVPVAISVAWNPILLPRGLVPAAVPLCILLAWALFDGVSQQRRLLVTLLVVPTLAAAAVLYYVNVVEQKGDSLVLAYVDWKPGDVVYHINDASMMLGHIYAPAAWPQYELPSDEWSDVGEISDTARAAMGFQIAPLDELTWHRAWVIYAASAMTAAAEDQAVAQLLSQYVYETIYDHRTSSTHEAIYLVWNYKLGPGVP